MSSPKDLHSPAKGKYAWTVKVGEKGQFVIPKEARELFGFRPGDTLIVLADEQRGIAIPPKNTFAELAARVFADPAQTEQDSLSPKSPGSL